MDSFKKYIQQHAEEMDTDLPGDEVWNRIQKGNAPVIIKISIVKRVWLYAAAACILAMVTAGVMVMNKKQPGGETAVQPIERTDKSPVATAQEQPHLVDTAEIVAQTITPATDASLNTAHRYPKKTFPKKNIPAKKKQPLTDPSQSIINDVEQNYAQLVNMQLQRLRIMPVYAESPDYFSIFKQQFRQIEADEAAIKKDIQHHGLTDELLQQLININQQKLNILKDLQAEISKLNNKVKQPETRQDSSRSYYLNM